MARQGIRTVSEVGRLAGVSGSYARQMALGIVPSQHVREAVAKVLGVEASKIWKGGAA